MFDMVKTKQKSKNKTSINQLIAIIISSISLCESAFQKRGLGVWEESAAASVSMSAYVRRLKMAFFLVQHWVCVCVN